MAAIHVVQEENNLQKTAQNSHNNDATGKGY